LKVNAVVTSSFLSLSFIFFSFVAKFDNLPLILSKEALILTVAVSITGLLT